AGMSVVLRTTDGGNTFSEIREISGIFQGSRGVFLGSAGDYWVVGTDSLNVSKDLGKSWQRVVIQSNNTEAGQFIGKSGHGFVVGTHIFSTIDSGGHWNKVLTSEEAHYFRALHFWDPVHGCAVGASSFIFCSSDGGSTWTKNRVLPSLNDASLSV